MLIFYWHYFWGSVTWGFMGMCCYFRVHGHVLLLVRVHGHVLLLVRDHGHVLLLEGSWACAVTSVLRVLFELKIFEPFDTCSHSTKISKSGLHKKCHLAKSAGPITKIGKASHCVALADLKVITPCVRWPTAHGRATVAWSDLWGCLMEQRLARLG